MKDTTPKDAPKGKDDVNVTGTTEETPEEEVTMIGVYKDGEWKHGPMPRDEWDAYQEEHGL